MKQSAGAAAVAEMAQLGPALAAPLLEYGLSVYQLRAEALAAARPDVVLTSLQAAHGAVLADALLDAALRAVLGYAPRVVHCAAADLEGVERDMAAVADALGAGEAGRRLVADQRRQLAAAADSARGRRPLRVALLQWPQPLMACGAWVPQLVALAGSTDVCGAVDHAEVLTLQQLEAAAPDVVVWALCGLDLDRAARAAAAAMRRLGSAWAGLPAARGGRVAVVDGTRAFSRPGPLLVPSMQALVELLHPEAQPFGLEGRLWRWLPSAT